MGIKLDTIIYKDGSKGAVETNRLQSWSRFKTAIGDYVKLSREDRHLTVFRGHGDHKWALETTIDRSRHFQTNAERLRCQNELLIEFKRESMLVANTDINSYDDDSLLLLARHHGLPTPVLDWSTSPYVAAFFAFANQDPKATHVAVWSLNRDTFLDKDVDIEIIDETKLIGRNERALSQKGLFMKITSNDTKAEESIADGLSRWTIPVKCRSEALNDLDEMGINNRSLLMNLDSAARTAAIRAGFA